MSKIEYLTSILLVGYFAASIWTRLFQFLTKGGGVKMFSTTQGNIETFSTQTQLVSEQLLVEEYDSDNENFQKPL